MVTAGKLRRKWAEEGAGLPASGYGTLGVCNDSTTVLEYTAEGTVTIFPLAHPPSTATQGDPIDNVLAALPSDVDGYEPGEALDRMLLTLPVSSLGSYPSRSS